MPLEKKIRELKEKRGKVLLGGGEAGYREAESIG